MSIYYYIIDDIFGATGKIKRAKKVYEESVKKLEKQKVMVFAEMDKLGTLELEVLDSFNEFSYLIEKIHNKPDFKEIYKGNSSIPVYTPEEFKKLPPMHNYKLLDDLLGIVGLMVALVRNIGLLNKANETLKFAESINSKCTDICNHLNKIYKTTQRHYANINMVHNVCKRYIKRLADVINAEGLTDWGRLSKYEKELTQNTILLIGILYSMLKIEVVLYDKCDETSIKANDEAVIRSETEARDFLDTMNIYQN